MLRHLHCKTPDLWKFISMFQNIHRIFFVQFLSNIGVLKQFGLVIDCSTSSLPSQTHKWKLPLKYEQWYVYIHPTLEIFIRCFSKTRILNLQKPFIHQSAGKLFEIIKRAHSENVNSELYKILEDIFKACQSGPTYAVPTFKFLKPIPHDNIVFNRYIAIVPMHFTKKRMLHIVYTANSFQNVLLIQSKSTEDI